MKYKLTFIKDIQKYLNSKKVYNKILLEQHLIKYKLTNINNQPTNQQNLGFVWFACKALDSKHALLCVRSSAFDNLYWSIPAHKHM